MPPELAVVIRPAAISDLEELAVFIHRELPNASARLIEAFFDAANRLAANPGIGAPVDVRNPV